MQTRLYILRGAPGSGKTTFVNNVLKPMLMRRGIPEDRIGHYEADDYFTDADGNYNWYPEGLKAAHAECQQRVRDGLAGAKDVVIVSNTSVNSRDVDTYVNIANEFNAPYEIIRMSTQFQNVHSVPEQVVQGMRDNLGRNRYAGEVTSDEFKELHKGE